MSTRKLHDDATNNTLSAIFSNPPLKIARKTRLFNRAFFWMTSAIASWMLLARLADLVIAD